MVRKRKKGAWQVNCVICDDDPLFVIQLEERIKDQCVLNDWEYHCRQIDAQTLLELDFYVWPRIQKIMAAEAFIKVFKDDSNEQFDDLKEENEDYKIDKLECTLERRTNIVKEIIKK